MQGDRPNESILEMRKTFDSVAFPTPISRKPVQKQATFVAKTTECDGYISVFLVLLSQRIFVTGEPHPDACESARVLAPCVERERPGFLLSAVVIWMLC